MFTTKAVNTHKSRVLRASAVWLVTSAVCVISLLVGGCSEGSGHVPDFTGMTLQEAESLAGDKGLQLAETEQVASFLPAGTVLAQNPSPGTSSSGNTVQVTVSREPIPVKVTKLIAYDVDGDWRENDSLLPNLIDGDLTTSWSTEQTYRSPDFSGLGDKVGVGFSFWLEEGATMLKVSYTTTGWAGEVQKIVNNMPIALAQLGQTQRVSWTQPITSGRIWFTQLAPLPDSDRYAAEIDEIEFYR